MGRSTLVAQALQSMAKMGLSTIIQRLLHSVYMFFQKLPHARTSALKVGCSKWWKGCKPIEETDIDLYAVKKIARPCLPAYSRWGILKLHDGFAQGPKHQIFRGHSMDSLLIHTNGHMVISNTNKQSHGDFDFPHSTCDQSSGLPGNVVDSMLLQISQWWNLDGKNYGGSFTLLSRNFLFIPRSLGWTKCLDHCRLLLGKEVGMRITCQCWW